MTSEELKQRISDKTVSDDEIYTNLVSMISDEKSADQIEAREIEEISKLTEEERPQVFKRITQLVAQQHKGCCGND